jgi:hypothetical protein
LGIRTTNRDAGAEAMIAHAAPKERVGEMQAIIDDDRENRLY